MRNQILSSNLLYFKLIEASSDTAFIAFTSVFIIEHHAHIGDDALHFSFMVALYMYYDILSGCHPVIARQ